MYILILLQDKDGRHVHKTIQAPCFADAVNRVDDCLYWALSADGLQYHAIRLCKDENQLNEEINKGNSTPYEDWLPNK